MKKCLKCGKEHDGRTDLCVDCLLTKIIEEKRAKGEMLMLGESKPKKKGWFK